MKYNIESEKYIVYIPFALSPGHALQRNSMPSFSEFGSHRIELKESSEGYALKFYGAETEKAAHAYFQKLRKSLSWASLRQKIGIKFPAEISAIRFSERIIDDDANDTCALMARQAGYKVLHGLHVMSEAAVIPESKKLLGISMGRANMLTSTPAGMYLNHIKDALNNEILNSIDQKKQFAIDLYLASHFEESRRVRLVQLITTLESLLEDAPLSGYAEVARQKVLRLVNELKADVPECERADLDKLISGIGDLKYGSISARLTDLVRETIEKDPEIGEFEPTIRQVKTAYSVRSQLVHSGTADATIINTAYAFLTNFVPRVLMCR